MATCMPDHAGTERGFQARLHPYFVGMMCDAYGYMYLLWILGVNMMRRWREIVIFCGPNSSNPLFKVRTTSSSQPWLVERGRRRGWAIG
jgi:hypothetical protein